MAMNWDTYFMGIARAVSAKSKDPHRKVGACLAAHDHSVVSCGYNGPPEGIDDDWVFSLPREKQRFYIIHAEKNAIIRAMRRGISVDGCTIYSTFSPCVECTPFLVACGIKRIVFYEPPDDGHWSRDSSKVIEFCQRMGVRLVQFDEKITRQV